MGKKNARTRRIPELQQGTYSDGHPLDEVQYLQCKIILKPDRFISVASFHEFGDAVLRTAEELGIEFSRDAGEGQRPRIKEIVFADTPDCLLYNNSFILRRRIAFEDGFPVGEPEIVFKFRHPDMQKAAELDVRPNIAGKYRIKFKAEALPLRDGVGGFRLLFSHNVEFGVSQLHEGDRTSMATLSRVFPALAALKRSDNERVELVSRQFVEEVLQDLGVLDFGKGITAKANVALWRTRGEHLPLIGEFSFQSKFKRGDEFHDKAKRRCEQFFVSLQHNVKDRISLGTTKTGVVYRLQGNQPQSHE
ncbi:MAG TPA: hypothetical protein VD811_04240 [Desulfuromonadales bacterium]|nr:hypothetical protein [Desulfuromonadales bacterium]